MSFTLETLYDTEKKILTCLDSVITTAKCKKLEELGEATLITPQIKKHHLASLILNLVETVRSTQCVLKRASVKMEKLQSDCITSQKSVINLQEQLIQCKDGEVVAVQSTVKSEIKSWADVVSKSESRKQLTTQSIHQHIYCEGHCQNRSHEVRYVSPGESLPQDQGSSSKGAVRC